MVVNVTPTGKFDGRGTSPLLYSSDLVICLIRCLNRIIVNRGSSTFSSFFPVQSDIQSRPLDTLPSLKQINKGYQTHDKYKYTQQMDIVQSSNILLGRFAVRNEISFTLTLRVLLNVCTNLCEEVVGFLFLGHQPKGVCSTFATNQKVILGMEIVLGTFLALPLKTNSVGKHIS